MNRASICCSFVVEIEVLGIFSLKVSGHTVLSDAVECSTVTSVVC